MRSQRMLHNAQIKYLSGEKRRDRQLLLPEVPTPQSKIQRLRTVLTALPGV